jgi:hypothetical protein
MDDYLTALAATRHTDDLRRAQARTLGRTHPTAGRRTARTPRLRAAIGRGLVAVGTQLEQAGRDHPPTMGTSVTNIPAHR